MITNDSKKHKENVFGLEKLKLSDDRITLTETSFSHEFLKI